MKRWQNRALIVGLPLLALLGGMSRWRGDPKAPSDLAKVPLAKAHAALAPSVAPPSVPRRVGAQTTHAALESEARARIDRATQTRDHYLASARYPPESRPIEERPDLRALHHVPRRRLPISRDPADGSKVRVVLSQDRQFLVGDDRATLSVACEKEGRPVPCAAISATLSPPPDMPPVFSVGAAPITFGPDGPGDGPLRALVQPSILGFHGYHGPLRVELRLAVGEARGVASFALDYTSSPPAHFTGKVREVLERGSLALYVGIEVRRAGRYILRARVDDADSASLAFLSFNDALAAGPGEACLVLFGKLARDRRAKAPFSLRDIEGFRLEENAYPDREHMPSMEGSFYTTKGYGLSDFSDAEWESEEKNRYVSALTRDVARAWERPAAYAP